VKEEEILSRLEESEGAMVHEKYESVVETLEDGRHFSP